MTAHKTGLHLCRGSPSKACLLPLLPLSPFTRFMLAALACGQLHPACVGSCTSLFITWGALCEPMHAPAATLMHFSPSPAGSDTATGGSCTAPGTNPLPRDGYQRSPVPPAPEPFTQVCRTAAHSRSASAALTCMHFDRCRCRCRPAPPPVAPRPPSPSRLELRSTQLVHAQNRR